MNDIPIFINHDTSSLENTIGRFVPYDLSPSADFIYGLMEQGYEFTISPQILDGKVIGISILTVTARQNKKFKERIDEINKV